jgi:hypothetical protein
MFSANRCVGKEGDEGASTDNAATGVYLQITHSTSSRYMRWIRMSPRPLIKYSAPRLSIYAILGWKPCKIHSVRPSGTLKRCAWAAHCKTAQADEDTNSRSLSVNSVPGLSRASP